MELTTEYLGLKLKNPIVCASSPISRKLDTAKQVEDAGASAIVMYSLFEEQINYDKKELNHFLSYGSDSFAEALSYFPEPETYFNMDADDYLEQIRKLKSSLSIPVIGSLNGVSTGGWTRYAKHIEEAGADAIELNIYYVPTNPALTASMIEDMYIEALKTVKSSVSIPVSLKVGGAFSAFANFAKRADEAGADGLVLFNRFFGTDIDLETLEVVQKLKLSSRIESQLPLRWIAILCGNIKASLAATSGIHTAHDAIKMTLAGADVSMIASAIFSNGMPCITAMLREYQEWMQKHDYSSVTQMKGSLSYKNVAEPAAYERANYMKLLHSYE